MKRSNRQFAFAAHRHVRGHGFTLIELVVALGMVAVLVVAMEASIHIAFQATDSANAAVAPGRTADLALEFLRADFENALQSSGFLAGTFEGTQGQDERGHESDDVIFYTTADSPQHAAANGEIKQVELKVVQAPNGDHVLVRRVIRNLLAQTLPNPDEEVVCRGVSSFSLQYFDGSNWNLTWDSTVEDNTVPAAVQVILQLDPPDGKATSTQFQLIKVFQLSCSTAAQDPTVNTGESLLQ